MISRENIVQEARTWLGTPFRRKGRVKGRGCDCVGLPLCVLRDLGIADWTEDFSTYPDQPVKARVLEVCKSRLKEKWIRDMQPGDLIVCRAPRVPCHVAIITGIGMIHAHAGHPRRVVEHVIDETWRGRIEACFELPGVAD